MKQAYDKNRRPIRVHDVLKVFHFIGPRRKRYYMYKQVADIRETMSGRTFLVINHLEQGETPYHLFVKDDPVFNDYEIVQGYEGGPFEQRKKLREEKERMR